MTFDLSLENRFLKNKSNQEEGVKKGREPEHRAAWHSHTGPDQDVHPVCFGTLALDHIWLPYLFARCLDRW